jgi:hypothetical protein
MSTPFVSGYEQAFLDAFGRGIEELPEEHAALVKAIVDKIHEEVSDRIMQHVNEEMASAAADHLRDVAAKMCSSMLGNALAGDDKQIRNLFGFNDWYLKHGYLGDHPTEWKLIDAIVERRPDIFLDERLAQRDREIADLRRDLQRARDRIHALTHPDEDATQ